jgi:hypothetical protein
MVRLMRQLARIRGNAVPAWGTIPFKAQARFRENHAILSNQWFATAPLATGKFAKMISGKSLIHKGLRDSARIV